MNIYQVNSFTSERFKGNPAGVCILDEFLETEIMQSIATEMNLSETAFVETREKIFKIRYFTPTQEVPLCGHATLASAHILYELGVIPTNDEFVFRAKESDLTISYKDNWIKMDFPVYKLTEKEITTEFCEVIGIKPIELYESDNKWIVARVETEKEVQEATPDFGKIQEKNMGLVIAVTAKSESSDLDFVVRVFCNPISGITEDPVTGAANCILVPFWNMKLEKTNFKSKQLSKRTGELKTVYKGNRVEIFGEAKTVFRIEMIE
jgi:PhzF family phenazine biosynthesis protein